MNSKVKYIWVTFSREGIHYYPQALEDPKLADVSFLGYPHRHIFHVRVDLEVFQNDRDVEFIQFKRWLESLYSSDGELNFNHQSCEMIGDALANIIKDKYPGRKVKISVSEDNENGSYAEYE